MIRRCAILLAFLVVIPPVSAQRRFGPMQNTPRANQGHVPPPPQRSGSPSGVAREALGNGRVNESQHVNHDQWFGHDLRDDPRFHLDRPFPRAPFPRVGPVFREGILRVDRGHHWFWIPGGFYFEVAPWDWPLFTDWCWNCGDDFVVYDDPYHPGWYLLYNVHTGLYVHVRYMGT